jgi:hypothetical protein
MDELMRMRSDHWSIKPWQDVEQGQEAPWQAARIKREEENKLVGGWFGIPLAGSWNETTYEIDVLVETEGQSENQTR